MASASEMEDERKLALEDIIYASALEPALWPDALNQIAENLQVAAATITISGNKPVELFPVGHEAPRGEFIEYWRGRNILAYAVEKNGEGLYCDWRMIAEKAIKKDAYYQDYRRVYGVKHLMGFSKSLGIHEKIRFNAHLHLASGIPEPQQLDDFMTISRHVCRAFDISRKIASDRSIMSGFGEQLSRSPHAAVVLDAEANVVVANDRFDILDANVIAISGGRLRCKNSGNQATVDALIHEALAPDPLTDTNSALLSRPIGRHPFVVKAVPLSHRHRDSATSDGLPHSHVLLFVMDLAAYPTSCCEESLRCLGLTDAECRTAALVGHGLAPRSIASILNLTEGTVRSNIKKIFMKLNLSRQSELAVYISRILMFDTTV